MQLPSAPARILVMDDDPSVLAAVDATLAGGGYAVTCAPDGQTGIHRFATAGGFDLVVTNLKMPHLDGFEVARRVKLLRPRTPIILMTGVPADELPSPEGLRSLGIEALVQKPLRRDELLARTEELLRSPRVPERSDERREAPRLPCLLPARVEPPGRPDEAEGYAVDASSGGLSILLPCHLMPADQVVLRLDAFGIGLQARGEIVWRKEVPPVAESRWATHGLRVIRFASEVEAGLYSTVLAKLSARASPGQSPRPGQA